LKSGAKCKTQTSLLKDFILPLENFIQLLRAKKQLIEQAAISFKVVKEKKYQDLTKWLQQL